MKPVTRQVTDQYVSQFSALPLNLMKRKTMEADAEAKKNQQGFSDLNSMFKSDSITGKDREDLAEKMKETQSRVGEIVKKYGNDFSKMGGEVSQLSNELNSWFVTGEGKYISENKAIQKDYYGIVDKSNMPSEDKKAGLLYSNYKFKQNGSSANKAEYTGISPYNMEDFNAKGLEQANKLKAEGTSEIIFNPETGMIISGYKDEDIVTRKRIKKVYRSAVFNNEGFDAMINYKWETRNHSNQVPQGLNKSQFKEYYFKKMFDGAEALSYRDKQIRITVDNAPSGSKYGSSNEIQATDEMNMLNTTANTTSNVDNQSNREVSKYYDPIAKILSLRTSVLDSFVNVESDYYELYTSQIIGGSENDEDLNNNYLEHLTDTLEKEGILGTNTSLDFDYLGGDRQTQVDQQELFNRQLAQTPWGKEQIIRLHAQGKGMDSFSPSVKNRLISSAKKQLTKLAEYDQILYDTQEFLYKKSLITKEEFEKPREFRKKLQTSLLGMDETSIIEAYEKKTRKLTDDQKSILLSQIRNFKINELGKIESDKNITEESVLDFKKMFRYLKDPSSVSDLNFFFLPFKFFGNDSEEGKSIQKQELFKILAKEMDLNKEDLDNALSLSTSALEKLNSPENKKQINKYLKDKATKKKNQVTPGTVLKTYYYMGDEKNYEKYDQSGKLIGKNTKQVQKDLIETVKSQLRKKYPTLESLKGIKVTAFDNSEDGTNPFKTGDLGSFIKTEQLKPENENKTEKDFYEDIVGGLGLLNETDNMGNYLLNTGKYTISVNNNNIKMDLDKYIKTEDNVNFEINALISSAKNSLAINYPLVSLGYEDYNIRFINEDTEPTLYKINRETNKREVVAIGEGFSSLKRAMAQIEIYSRKTGNETLTLSDGKEVTKDEFLSMLIKGDSTVTLKGVNKKAIDEMF